MGHSLAGASLQVLLIPTEVVVQVEAPHKAVGQALAVHRDDSQHAVLLVGVSFQSVLLHQDLSIHSGVNRQWCQQAIVSTGSGVKRQ